MERDEKQGARGQAAASRRRLLAVAAAAPVLAGAAQQSARAATTTAVTTTAVTTTPATTTPATRGMADKRDPGGAGTPLRPVATTEADWEGVADALHGFGIMKGTMLYACRFSRGDLRVVSHGVTLAAALLGIHFGFIRYEDGGTTLMGDMAVTEDELQGVCDALRVNGIAVTAVHKHLLGQRPEIWWIHLHAHGHDPVALARAARAAVDRTSAPSPTPRPPDAQPPEFDLDMAGIDAALGVRGTVGDEMYNCLFARRETVVDGGRVMPQGLGSISAFNFQPLGGGRAALVGDLALVADEVAEAMLRLTTEGIDVVCLHNHGLTEEPRLFFIHCWAVGDAVRIAEALRPAIDATDVDPVEGGVDALLGG